MSKIRKSAQDKPCDVRLPGICNFDNSTTVAAHIRIAGVTGVGMKPSDLLTVRACSACHDVMDGRVKTDFNPDFIRMCVYEGHLRTLIEYEKEGVVKCS